MKTGKITAKLRDAVPVCLMVNGEEVKRYKNIELPDALKEVEMTDFHFNVHMDGKITFEIHYEEGALPEIFPEADVYKRQYISTTVHSIATGDWEMIGTPASPNKKSNISDLSSFLPLIQPALSAFASIVSFTMLTDSFFVSLIP